MTDDELIARILYRDGSVLIVDKPAGIPVHAGFGGGETLDQHFPALQFGLPNPPQLGHRLDKDTSGCLALGRHRRAIRELGEIFAGQKAQKTYLAVVLGHLPDDEGRVDAPLAKVTHEKRSWWMKVDPAGQASVTDYRVIARGERLTVVDLMPRTGRTHQLRVHMAHLGCPIVGDGVYGGDPARAVDRNLHLHARELELPYYRKKPPILARAPVPPHMLRLLGRLGAVDDDGVLLHLPTAAAPDPDGGDAV